MKRGDIVKIKRGVWKGIEAKVTEVTSGGARVGVDVKLPAEWLEQYPFAAHPEPFSLAVTSVELVAPR